MLCEQAVGLVRGKRLILESVERSYLESLNYEALAAAHAQDEAVVCALHFENVRDSLLQLYPWVFARKTAAPAQLASNISGWKYSFVLPYDCLKVLAVIADDNRPNFYEVKEQDLSTVAEKIELLEYEQTGENLFTNRSPIYVRYQAKITDINKWGGAFQNAFVIKLAEAIAPAIRADSNVVQGLENSFTQIIQAAFQNGLISADTGLQKQRETRPINDYAALWLDYSGIKS